MSNRTQQMIDFIAKQGSARTDVIAAHLKCSTSTVSASLVDKVRSGQLVMCKVEIPGKPPQNEYRIGSGIPAIADRVPDLKVSRPVPERQFKPTAVNAPPPAAQAPAEQTKQIGAVIPLHESHETKAASAETPTAAAETITSADAPLGFSLDNHGQLTLRFGAVVIALNSAETIQLGEFLVSTEEAWS